MKKTILLTLATLLIVIVCFSQIGTTDDGDIGIVTELSNNKQYLKVIGLWKGSPAYIYNLHKGDRIYQIDGKKVSELTDPMSHIKGVSGTSVKLTIDRFNNTDVFEASFPRISIPFGDDNYASEGMLAALIRTKGWTNLSHNFAISTKLLYDSSRDMFKYKTYNFEYTNAKDPLMEKEIFNKLGGYLDQKGMKRSEENPDLIILMNNFAGKKEQYVPPQQVISTTTQSHYNIFWGTMQTTPLTSSTTKPGYTDVTYLTTVNLKFLDAKEIEGSKIPPVVWSGSFSKTSKSKIELMDFSNDSFMYMNFNFPEVYQQSIESYYFGNYSYTGIWYKKDNLRFISEVIPKSPAWKSGLRKGDEIKTINKSKVYPYYDKAKEDCTFYNMVMLKRLGGLRYLYLHANLTFKPYKEGVTTLDFIIKREGKKMNFTVTPEAKSVLLEW